MTDRRLIISGALDAELLGALVAKLGISRALVSDAALCHVPTSADIRHFDDLSTCPRDELDVAAHARDIFRRTFSERRFRGLNPWGVRHRGISVYKFFQPVITSTLYWYLRRDTNIRRHVVDDTDAPLFLLDRDNSVLASMTLEILADCGKRVVSVSVSESGGIELSEPQAPGDLMPEGEEYEPFGKAIRSLDAARDALEGLVTLPAGPVRSDRARKPITSGAIMLASESHWEQAMALVPVAQGLAEREPVVWLSDVELSNHLEALTASRHETSNITLANEALRSSAALGLHQLHGRIRLRARLTNQLSLASLVRPDVRMGSYMARFTDTQVLNQFCEYLAAFEKVFAILERERPRAVIVPSSTNTVATVTCLAARALGIRSIALQETIWAYEDRAAEVFADQILVADDTQSEIARDLNRLSGSCIHTIGGLTRIDGERQFNPAAKEVEVRKRIEVSETDRVVTLFLQPLSPCYVRRVVGTLLKSVAGMPNVVLVLKTHPTMHMGIRALVRGVPGISDGAVRIVDDVDSSELSVVSDVFVSCWSTVSLEAMQQGVPSLLIHLLDEPNPLPNWDRYCLMARSGEEARAIIDDLVHGGPGKRRWTELTARAREEGWLHDAGVSTANAVKSIWELSEVPKAARMRHHPPPVFGDDGPSTRLDVPAKTSSANTLSTKEANLQAIIDPWREYGVFAAEPILRIAADIARSGAVDIALAYCERAIELSAERYLALRPDVRHQVEQGLIPSALDHFARYGRYENQSWPNKEEMSLFLMAMIEFGVEGLPDEKVSRLSSLCHWFLDWRGALVKSGIRKSGQARRSRREQATLRDLVAKPRTLLVLLSGAWQEADSLDRLRDVVRALAVVRTSVATDDLPLAMGALRSLRWRYDMPTDKIKGVPLAHDFEPSILDDLAWDVLGEMLAIDGGQVGIRLVAAEMLVEVERIEEAGALVTDAIALAERDYVERRPDILSAVERGEFARGLEHYLLNGREEGAVLSFEAYFKAFGHSLARIRPNLFSIKSGVFGLLAAVADLDDRGFNHTDLVRTEG